MAVYKLFPEKDASIYSAYPSMNTGLDAILDVANYVTTISPEVRVARSLVKFNQPQISDVIENIASVTSSLNFTASLRSFIAKATNVTIDSSIQVFPIYGEWNNGTGQYLDNKQNTTGVSWIFQSYSGSNPWITSNFPSLITGSYSGSNTQGGGTWWTGSGGYNGVGSLEATQSFSLRSDKDLNINVTDIVKVWYSASLGLPPESSPPHIIDNEGFIIKWEDDVEFTPSLAITPQLSFYSIDTNTIYPPQLEIKWRDYTYSLGNLSVISTPNVFVSLENNIGVYYSESIVNFKLNVRPEFPIRTFNTQSNYTKNHALPPASYYAIKDLDTNEFVVEFDEVNTQISCNSSGSNFTVYMNGLEPERYYQILIQTTIGNNTIVKDENYYFKVING